MRSLAALAAALALSACGQKGPLFLPDEGGEVVVRPAPSTSTDSPPPKPDEEGKAKTPAPVPSSEPK